VEITAKIIEEEKREYLVAVARDISQRKQAEEEIAVFKKFAEASEQGFGMADLDGGITYSNAALCRQIGVATSEDVRGKHVSFYYSGEHRERLENESLPVVMEKGYWTGELDLLSIKGNITHTIQSFFLIRDNDGRPLYLANVSTDITERRQTEERIHTLTQELITAQENERQRISRELHDHVAQDLAASRMTCGLLLNHERTLDDDVYQDISMISDTLGAAIGDIRDLSYDLRPPDLEEWGLAGSISLYCEDFSQKTGMDVEFHPTGIDHLILKTDSGIHIFRMIQEGLNNIWKHADASLAIIKLVGAFPNMILRIEDNGKGFDVNRRMVQVMEEKRMGLRNMEERARLLHGQMKVQSRPRVGTIISIKFPYGENRDESKKGHINP
jgi:PAS domain S-box-containing protein